jgi:hypothetical protein
MCWQTAARPAVSTIPYFDVMIGSPAPPMNPDAEYDDVKEFEAKND